MSSSSQLHSHALVAAEVEDTRSSLLCLKCRQVGHIVTKCPSPTWSNEFEWYFSTERRQMKFEDTLTQELCARCQDLNVLVLLHQKVPWKSREGLDNVQLDDNKHVRKLGLTGTIEFRNHCSLCRCLFAMTPNPSFEDQSIYLVPVWSVTFVEGVDGIVDETDESFVYANCLVIVIDPNKRRMTPSDQIHRGDGLCIHEEDDNEVRGAMGGRTIDLSRLNITLIQAWISICERFHHIDCKPLWTEDTHTIRLIDVNSRQVVAYPETPCDYVALSYVWGGVVQDRFRVGSTVGRVHQTIEDAMWLVIQLGKAYLWVDAICMDQADSADKTFHIQKMSTIYRGAYVTLMVLPGASANSGIPRVGSYANGFSQLFCRIGEKRLVGSHPSLLQQTWTHPWGKRSWTLQEALLSPRCLYFSDHQVYFECNAMTCTEALNETKSWIHQLNRNLSATRKRYFQGFTGGGALRNPFYGQTGKRDRLRHYGTRVRLYSMRSMTDPGDAINAITGILQNLEAIYPRGFFWGLPIDDLPWTLLWRFQFPPTRRLHFPTWSWAGWKGTLAPTYPLELSKPYQLPVYCHAWKVASGQLLELFKNKACGEACSAASQGIFENDPVCKLEIQHRNNVSTLADFNVGTCHLAESSVQLFLSAILLTITQPFKHVNAFMNDVEDITRASEILLQNVPCAVNVVDPGFEIRIAASKPVYLLLLARDYDGKGHIDHHTLVVGFDEEGQRLARRMTTATLSIPQSRLDVLEEWKPEIREVILV